VGEATGLGLAVAYGIVREHGGWIVVESVPRQGTTFSAFFPCDGSSP
jgi:signal transduction histidine kinase